MSSRKSTAAPAEGQWILPGIGDAVLAHWSGSPPETGVVEEVNRGKARTHYWVRFSDGRLAAFDANEVSPVSASAPSPSRDTR